MNNQFCFCLRINYRWIILITLIFSSCTSIPKKEFPELRVVSYVDLERYLGKWYEIARYPNSFEEGCFGSTAFYEKMNDGKIKVINQCMKHNPKGNLIQAIGKAYIVDKVTNAKLKVQFFWPFKGDYWIIILEKDYQYAVVSEPNRQFLWILSRSKRIEAEKLELLKRKIRQKGFDLSYLITTPQ